LVACAAIDIARPRVPDNIEAVQRDPIEALQIVGHDVLLQPVLGMSRLIQSASQGARLTEEAAATVQTLIE
jgi:hypothetical protein